MKKTRTTGGKAPVEEPKLRRRKRVPVADFYLEPEQPKWRLRDEDWGKIEDECLFDLDGEVRDSLCDIIKDYFYFRELELATLKLDDVQAFLARVREAAAALAMLLAANPVSPKIMATRDVLREALFDPLNPSFDPESYCVHDELSGFRFKTDQSFEAAHDAIERFDPFDDIVSRLERLIKETNDFMVTNVAIVAKNNSRRRAEPPAWDEMVREITLTLKAAGLSTGVKSDSSKGASNFVLLMLELTRRWPEKFRQHQFGRNGEESCDAMAKAIREARRANGKSGGGR